jgi:putative ABC transport system permease protein
LNLAYHDVRRRLGRFTGTVLGLGLLFTVVLAMAGIYNGLVDDALLVLRTVQTDLWVVQRGSRGPFADISRLDPTVESRVAAVPGVSRARSYTYQVIQREEQGQSLRAALVGLAWPEDRGGGLPLIAGRALEQSHGELIADASLRLPVGASLHLGDDEYRIVGLTRNALTSAGDPVVFLSVADALSISQYLPPDAILTERERAVERLRETDVGRSLPALEELVRDPRWRRPAFAPPPVNAILVEVEAPFWLDEVRQSIAALPDVSVYTSAEQADLLLRGLVNRARMQLGLFSAILTLTSAVVVAMVVYTMTTDKTHDIAVLKLLGTPTLRIASMVLQEAWLLGAAAYGVALLVGHYAFPHFARRVVLTDAILMLGAGLVLVIMTLSSTLGVGHALRVDAGKALEG